MTYSNQATAIAVLLKKLAGGTALLFLLCSLSTNVFAQNGATIKGRVADERAAAIPGAEVRLRSRTGIRLFARTDDGGVYAFNGLAPGFPGPARLALCRSPSALRLGQVRRFRPRIPTDESGRSGRRD